MSTHSGLGSGKQKQDISSAEVCSICLDPIAGEAFLDKCFHRFCYHCILQWSEMVLAASLARSGNPKRLSPLVCPLCKTEYTSIIHDFVAGTRYQRDFLVSSDGSRFQLSETHKRRQTVYLGSEATSIAHVSGRSTDLRTSAGLEKAEGGSVKRSRRGGAVQANRWLPCWVRRELQALMQEEDVEMVTHHIVGVVESLQKRGKGNQSRNSGSTEGDWHAAVSAAVQPFVFEHSEKFAEELWSFLDSGIDIAFYGPSSVSPPFSESFTKVESDAATGIPSTFIDLPTLAFTEHLKTQHRVRLDMYDEDVEGT